MKISDYGKKISRLALIAEQIMEIQKLRKQKVDNLIDLSSGEPRLFPELESAWNGWAKEIIAEENLGTRFGKYGSLNGDEKLLKALINLFKPYGIELNPENIFITPGSIACFFYAINTFAGIDARQNYKILLPVCPEYMAYANKGLDEKQFISLKPKIEIIDEHIFRYGINFEELDLTEVGMILLTRPNNPTGLILPDDELQCLVSLAAEHNIPVVIDGVYSFPIPDLVYKNNVKMVFGKNVIFAMSFSKAGFAGGRLGVSIGDADFLKPLRAFQLNVCITMQAFSQMIVARALESQQLQPLLKNVVRPYYQSQLKLVENLFKEYMSPHVPYYLHQPDGGIFQWVWFKDLPITDQNLNEILKSNNVFVMPGNMFFFALPDKNWRHHQECIRISLNESEDNLALGIKKLAEVVNKLYVQSLSSLT